MSIGDEILGNKIKTQRHPNCPLISIDIDELEEAMYILSSNLDLSLLMDNAMNEQESIVVTTLKREKEMTKSNAINTIKSTIDKLKGEIK